MVNVKEKSMRHAKNGEIPEGWGAAPLAELARVNEQTIDKTFGFDEIEYIDIASVDSGQKTVEKNVEKTVEKIHTLIKANPQITQQKLMDQTGLTRRGVEWNLKKLKSEGRIQRIGPDKGGHWEITKK